MSLLIYLGCITVKHDLIPQDAPNRTIDCFELSLRDDVPITISVDFAPEGVPRTEYMIALAYEETTSSGEEFRSGETRFANIYLIVTGLIREEVFVARIARLIINIWIHDSADLTKTCYQWRLSDADFDGIVENVAAEVITENQENTVTGIRPLETPNRDMNDYSQLYRNCLDHFLKSLKLHSLDDLFERQADNLYKEKQLVL